MTDVLRTAIALELPFHFSWWELTLWLLAVCKEGKSSISIWCNSISPWVDWGIQLSKTEALFLTASHPGNWNDRTGKTLNSHNLALLTNSRDKESNYYFTFSFQSEAESTNKYTMFFVHIKYWAAILKEWLLKRLLWVLGWKIPYDPQGGFVAVAASSASLLGFVSF